ncbi:hypothetical protein [Rhizobium sp. BK176]|uniref:hypothetical protein n=1 Tax=Rhizobium sp. BK176 TaxID=2587071 RepID=UPI002167B55D|nr:hypothetical protein [Rhizobium sp. BK176]MCS4088941.1 hypothetical protein [Rhizobium sp. BK176]
MRGPQVKSADGSGGVMLLRGLQIGGARTELDYGLQTKRGEPLRFVYEEYVPGTNRCYKLDEIGAYIGDIKVGYILVENVPSHVFESFCPTVLHYAATLGGHVSLFPEDTVEQALEELSIETLRRIAHRLTFLVSWPGKNMDHLQSLAEFELFLKSEMASTRWFKNAKKAYDDFRVYNLDKPKIGYVNTKGEALNVRGLFSDNSGQRIGIALYQVAAMEMARRGLEFYLANQLTSEDAKVMHGHFEKAGWLVRENHRVRLDGMAIAADLGVALEVGIKPAKQPSFVS